MHDLKEDEKRQLEKMQRNKGLHSAHPAKRGYRRLSHEQRAQVNDAELSLQGELQRLLENSSPAP